MIDKEIRAVLPSPPGQTEVGQEGPHGAGLGPGRGRGQAPSSEGGSFTSDQVSAKET